MHADRIHVSIFNFNPFYKIQPQRASTISCISLHHVAVRLPLLLFRQNSSRKYRSFAVPCDGGRKRRVAQNRTKKGSIIISVYHHLILLCIMRFIVIVARSCLSIRYRYFNVPSYKHKLPQFRATCAGIHAGRNLLVGIYASKLSCKFCMFLVEVLKLSKLYLTLICACSGC